MSKIEIYYFSGTGNSLKVAKDLSKDLNADLISVVSLFDKDTVKSDAEMIGIVFPIYDFKAPMNIDDFIKKLQLKKETYFFAVCTYGVLPLKTMKKLKKVFDNLRFELSAGFTVKMPHNGIGYKKIPKEKQDKMFANWNNKRKEIIDHLNHRNTVIIENNNSLYYLYLGAILLRMMPILFRMLKQVILHGWSSLGFVVNKDCNSCTLCERICPVDNITIKKGIPEWSDKCINCFACLHWCPKEAINAANLTVNMHRYHQPEITVKEMLEQKKESFMA